MTDRDDSRRGARGPGETPEPGAGDPEEALRSLERLEALARGEEPPPAAPVPGPPPRRTRPRLSAPSRSAQAWARIAAPVAFLVAVIVVVSLAFQSGVVGGGAPADGPAKPTAKASPKASKSAKPTSTPKATESATPGGTRTYTVKPGDTLSGIAARFDTTVTAIEELNADKDLTTLQPGQKLTVPPR